MNSGEARYRIARYGALAGMWVRRTGRFGLPFEKRRVPARFAFCRATQPQLAALPWSDVDGDAALARAETLARALAGADAVAYWHGVDGTTRCWPLAFFPSLGRRQGEADCDLQTAWTRARLQALVELGLVCRQSNDAAARTRAVRAMDALLASWLTHNPWLQGIHYLSTMECALRLISVCHGFDLARAHVTSTESWRRVLDLVHGHAHFIRRRLCLYSSAGNHTIGECAGLVYAGTLFPELPESATWLELGLTHLAREVDVQILDDGGNREQSFRYLAMMADLCGLVVAQLRHIGRPVPSAIEAAWQRARAFLWAFATTPERLPPVGDSDDGWALSPYLRLSWPDDPTQTPPAARGVRTFATSGYTLFQGGDDEGSLRFAHGSLGTARGFGHGHADALSVCWDLGGRSLLVDPGTYLYASDTRFRRYFRSTAAHNTLVVDGRDQAGQGGGAFGWTRPYTARLVWRHTDAQGATVVLACHDGYRDLGVTHWRAVIHRPGQGWWVWDRVTGAGEHALDLHWHLDATADAAPGGYRVTRTGMSRYLRLHGGRHDIVCGDANRPLGWIARRYGTREPLATILCSAVVTLPHEFLTTLSARRDGDADDAGVRPFIGALRERSERAPGAAA